MKKTKSFFLLAISLFVFLSFPQWTYANQENLDIAKKESNGFNFSIKLFGNLGHLIGKHDVNEAHKGWNSLVRDLYQLYEGDVNGKLANLGLGPYFGGELIMSFFPRFSVGLGVGYIQFTRDSTVLITDPWSEQENNRKPLVKAIPITLSLYYSIPLGHILKASVGAGVGYYIGTYQYDTHDHFNDNNVSLLYEADSNSIGFHGGLDLELNINRTMALVFGVSGRCAKLKDLTGTWTYTHDWLGEDQTVFLYDRTLWYVEEDYSDGPDDPLAGKWYATLLMYEKKPEASFYRNVRKAKVSLSSMALQIGFLIRLNQLFKKQ